MVGVVDWLCSLLDCTTSTSCARGTSRTPRAAGRSCALHLIENRANCRITINYPRSPFREEVHCPLYGFVRSLAQIGIGHGYLHQRLHTKILLLQKGAAKLLDLLHMEILTKLRPARSLGVAGAGAGAAADTPPDTSTVGAGEG